MRLDEVNRGIRKNKKRKRVGRGPGSGHGKTCGRGEKGQRSRAGWSSHPTFQGGAMPMVRRIPKRGFNNRWALKVLAVNVRDLEARFQAGDEVNPDSLRARSLAKGRYDVLKVLGAGELTKALTVTAHRFSKTAVEKIEKAGGKVVILPGKTPLAEKLRRKPAEPASSEKASSETTSSEQADEEPGSAEQASTDQPSADQGTDD
jgi:large subunit ribosomal protein L15